MHLTQAAKENPEVVMEALQRVLRAFVDYVKAKEPALKSAGEPIQSVRQIIGGLDRDWLSEFKRWGVDV